MERRGLEKVASLGGANGPFEMILTYVGGPMPDGLPWQFIRTLQVKQLKKHKISNFAKDSLRKGVGAPSAVRYHWHGCNTIATSKPSGPMSDKCKVLGLL